MKERVRREEIGLFLYRNNFVMTQEVIPYKDVIQSLYTPTIALATKMIELLEDKDFIKLHLQQQNKYKDVIITTKYHPLVDQTLRLLILTNDTTLPKAQNSNNLRATLLELIPIPIYGPVTPLYIPIQREFVEVDKSGMRYSPLREDLYEETVPAGYDIEMVRKALYKPDPITCLR
jgi:hypothetical protein